MYRHFPLFPLFFLLSKNTCMQDSDLVSPMQALDDARENRSLTQTTQHHMPCNFFCLSVKYAWVLCSWASLLYLKINFVYGLQRKINSINIQGFWHFVQSWSREFHVNLWNAAKFSNTYKIPWNSLHIIPNTCHYNIFETYLECWGCLLAVNLQICCENSSLQQVNNIPKLPGILRLML